MVRSCSRFTEKQTPIVVNSLKSEYELGTESGLRTPGYYGISLSRAFYVRLQRHLKHGQSKCFFQIFMCINA